MMTAEDCKLCERLKRLGFSHDQRIKLYGEEFELLGDPIVTGRDTVIVDAIEKKSRKQRRIRIPLPIVKMAEEHRKAA